MPGVILSGISHPVTRIAPSGEIEIHATEEALRALRSQLGGTSLSRLTARPCGPWGMYDSTSPSIDRPERTVRWSASSRGRPVTTVAGEHVPQPGR